MKKVSTTVQVFSQQKPNTVVVTSTQSVKGITYTIKLCCVNITSLLETIKS